MPELMKETTPLYFMNAERNRLVDPNTGPRSDEDTYQGSVIVIGTDGKRYRGLRVERVVGGMKTMTTEIGDPLTGEEAV
jgi:hypothetical protein